MKEDKARPGETPEQLVGAAKKCMQEQEYELGIAYCDKALEIDEKCAEAYCARGGLRNAVNDFDAAIKDLELSIEINPTPLAYSLLGDTYCEKRDFVTAIKNYNMILDLDPDDTIAINDRAEAYSYMGDYDNAIKDYERLKILLPKEPSPHYNCGVCHRRKGALAKAVENFDKTIGMGNREAHVYKSRGLALMDMGEYDRAIADFKRVEELGDDFGSLYLKAAIKKRGACERDHERNDNPGGADGILDINKINAMEAGMMEQYDIESYHNFLCDKFVDFIEDKEILEAHVRSGAELLEPAAQYALLMFGGLIVSCFELPVFKSRPCGADREDEMTQYIKKFHENGKSLVSGLSLALAFDDNYLKERYAEFIRQSGLLPESELGPVHGDVYGVLARYPTKQPVLREYITELVFAPSFECAKKSKIFLFLFLYFIIDFLNEYYFEPVQKIG
jgi:tetratricopeptide (TPR) repeat protein